MKLNKHNLKSGFTLAELLAAMMVFSIIMLACANLVNQAGNSFKLGMAQVESQDIARVLNQELFRSLTGAVYADTYPFIVETNVKSGSALEGGASQAFELMTTSPTKLHFTQNQVNTFWAEKAASGIPKGTIYVSTRWPSSSGVIEPKIVFGTMPQIQATKTRQYWQRMFGPLMYAFMIIQELKLRVSLFLIQTGRPCRVEWM